ncbi:MAG: DNA primase DnaG [Sulfolobaceae archaeon]
MKYNIRLKFEVEGIVDKPDVIGAIFGQTENLFGSEFDLRELQEKGRLGRIVVELKQKGNRVEGEITIPSNLDRVETALIAAMVEKVEKVGPYSAKFQLIEIQDVRAEKIKSIIERAKEILASWSRERSFDIKEVINEISSAIRVGELIEYGKERLPAGPDVETDPTLVLVEGRADVINLLRYGYKNVIAVEGAQSKIPDSLVELTKRKKTVIAFLDGDHGGDLILKELLSHNVKIDYVARAPTGREVEELTSKEIAKALSNMIPLSQYLKRLQEAQQQLVVVQQQQQQQQLQEQIVKETVLNIPSQILEEVKKLPGTLEGIFLDSNWNLVERVQVRDIVNKLENLQTNTNIAYIVFDGVITQRLVDLAALKGIKLLIGARIGSLTNRPSNVQILTFNDILFSS